MREAALRLAVIGLACAASVCRARTYDLTVRRTVPLPSLRAVRELAWETRARSGLVRLGRAAEAVPGYGRTARTVYRRSGPDRRRGALLPAGRRRGTTWEAFAAGALGPLPPALRAR